MPTILETSAPSGPVSRVCFVHRKQSTLVEARPWPDPAAWDFWQASTANPILHAHDQGQCHLFQLRRAHQKARKNVVKGSFPFVNLYLQRRRQEHGQGIVCFCQPISTKTSLYIRNFLLATSVFLAYPADLGRYSIFLDMSDVCDLVPTHRRR
jgi:hypothetical protein